jgi:hypothetical protein
MGCYLYNQENHHIDTTGFHSVTIPTNTYPIGTLALRPASYAIVAIGPLAQVYIYGIFTNP